MNTFTQRFWTAFTTLGLHITGQMTQQFATGGVDDTVVGTTLAA